MVFHAAEPASYVNTFVGTDRSGDTYPGAQAPFGMVLKGGLTCIWDLSPPMAARAVGPIEVKKPLRNGMPPLGIR